MSEKSLLKKNKQTSSVGRRMHSNPNGYWFVLPYALLFAVFILAPVVMAVVLSFTNFNAIQFPKFVGFLNYINLITSDDTFMKFVLPNTVKYALIVGVGGYILSFLLAWALANLPKGLRTVFALILYSPSMTTGVAMAVLWKILFTGDQTGYINSWLMSIGAIDEPIIWLVNTNYLLPIVIIIGLWSSMGVGFLSILAGLLNVDESLYEAAAIDGVKNRFQEMIYVTIPCMKPQMLFAAVMQIVGAFQNGMISTLLAGNPTPGYAAQLIVNALWTPIFFALELRLVAFVWILILIGLVITMIAKFKKVDAPAGNLQFPYLVWLLFAAYLNLGVFLLNM